MPRYLEGWLADVVKISLSRERINKVRERPIYLLSKFIKSTIDKNAIIAEFKRKSPSGLNENRDLEEYVKFMEENGAIGISVLTEEKYFGGSYSDLENAAKIVKIPILMKDFIVTEKQIDTAFNLGADAILLIVKILTERELINLYEYARNLGLEAIVEVTDENDLKIALRYDFNIIGVNARNLSSLEVNIRNARKILEMIPNDRIKIAESGIKNKEDIIELKKYGADAFLIGTTLMKDPNKIKELI
ncbi:indole-3-glycerol phosphate synthase TrpC [Sulfurisphaera ohwakuensis]|uniref:Indole-3-glycerol phosphate synthase n=1 Tax=Sulfurisphaera ohwakuensis TaxID=69656 RepID=A0A650CH12_SULOH|nr:indole-3-glycerol phosphate synthase TrpC [Sulfurisphaera ohwakuensis]MBB5252582.1 indole-3-glycerol phosphate synthase [Sulfurisphaera ohwakuensis]QGR16975.1 indole-3-glycerol phosphate synthase TrpC [Sulfurisphaera ohwakuensis]